MIEDFKLVRPAIDAQAALDEDTSVVVSNGWMFLRNLSMGIAQPTTFEDCSFPAIAFDVALKSAPDANVTLTAKSVMVKGAVRDVRVPRTSVTTTLPKPDVELHDVPSDLIDAVEAILPFAGSGDKGRVWTTGARVDSTCITATNAVVMVQSYIEEQHALEGVTLSLPLLEHIARRGSDLKRWGANKKLVLLEFADGGWCAGLRLNEEMPDGVLHAMDSWTQPEFEISDDYRATFMSSVTLTEDVLEVYGDHVYGAKLASDYHTKLTTPVANEPAIYDAKNLALVIQRAKQVGFDLYPAATPFSLERGRGLLAGRSKT